MIRRQRRTKLLENRSTNQNHLSLETVTSISLEFLMVLKYLALVFPSDPLLALSRTKPCIAGETRRALSLCL